MPKQRSDFPEHLNLRLTTQQRAFLDDLGELHGLKASDIVRGFIESARADQAIQKIEEVLGALD